MHCRQFVKSFSINFLWRILFKVKEIMNCKKAEELLVAYMYGELSAKQVLQVEKHLQVCDACAKTLESWRAIHQGFRKTADDEPQAPGYLKQKLMIAAKKELTRKPSFTERFAVLLKPALILPVVVFVLLTILYLPWHPGSESKQARIPSRAVIENEKKMAGISKTDRLETGATNATAPALKDYAEKKYANKELAKDQGFDQVDQLKRQNMETALDEREKKEEKPSSVASEGAPVPAAPSAEPPPQEMAAPDSSAVGGLAARQEEAAKQKSVAQNQPVAAAKIAEQEEADNVYYNEAQSRFRKDDLKGGVKLAQQAIERDNTRALAAQFHQTGIQYQQSRECGKAIPQFLLVINNYGDYPDLQNVLIRLAACYEEIGQINAARKEYVRLQSYPSTRDLATQKIQQLDKKIQSQEQLKALGYTTDKN